MTQTPEPIDLAAVQDRYDTFDAAWIGYPYETGETEAEYRERVESLLHSDAATSAQDVPALIAEIYRLRELTKVYGEEPVDAPAEGPGGLIAVTGHRDAEQWVLTCDEHGELGRWPVVPYTDKTEPELAWDRHIAECGPS